MGYGSSSEKNKTNRGFLIQECLKLTRPAVVRRPIGMPVSSDDLDCLPNIGHTISYDLQARYHPSSKSSDIEFYTPSERQSMKLDSSD